MLRHRPERYCAGIQFIPSLLIVLPLVADSLMPVEADIAVLTRNAIKPLFVYIFPSANGREAESWPILKTTGNGNWHRDRE
jgi:hypothetical protein